MRLLKALIIVFALLPCALFAASASLTGMRIQPSPTLTQVTFMLSQKTTGRIKYLPRQQQVIVDFINTTRHFTMQNARLMGSNIRVINSEITANGILRFVFIVRGNIRFTSEFLPNPQGNGVLFQIKIFTIQKDKTKTHSYQKKIFAQQLKKKFQTDILKAHTEFHSPLASPSTSSNVSSRLTVLNSVTPKQKSRTFVIVIDAGHGGKDSGARGVKGAQEKNVVLAIAKRLAKKINQQPYMRAILTRSDDQYVSLRNRLKLARKGNADLFIAIHADAYFDNSATGASVYALSNRGATSEASRWLAQQENYSELDGIAFSALKDHSRMLRSVLIDLAQTVTIRDSLRLGTTVLDALDEISALHYPHVEQAPFVVLKSPDIPSILVETGFISNPNEEQRLTSSNYQMQIASALFQGINQYVKKYASLVE